MSYKAKITKRLLDTLKPTGADRHVWDTDLAGFGIRERASGGMTYVVVYRRGEGRAGAKQRVTIAKVGTLTPEEARKEARRILADVAQGKDPAGAKAEARAACTVANLVETWLARHVEAKRKEATAESYAGLLRKHVVPRLGTKAAREVTRSDIAKMHLAMGETPAMANRVLAVLSAMFGWAVKHGLLPEDHRNPARGIERYRDAKRERFLSGDELARLGEAIREAETVGVPWQVDETRPTAKHVPKGERRTTISPHAAAALRLLILTGCRLREILHLKWDEVDFERGCLFLPDSKTGRKTVVLAAPALQVLAELPRVGRYVIAGEVADKPRADLKRPWEVVARRAGLVAVVPVTDKAGKPVMGADGKPKIKREAVRLHDLRHSFASIGAGASLGLPVIGKLLGHTQAATTARYAHLDTDPLRRAANTIAGRIAEAMGEPHRVKAGGEGPGEVVPIGTAKCWPKGA